MSLLEVSNLKKIYTTRFGGAQVQALTNVSFSVLEGEYVAIMGESGSGKTTLLNILAALDRPTSGQVLLDGRASSPPSGATSWALCSRISTSLTPSRCATTSSCPLSSRARVMRR